jgi:hypothetical protein
MESDLPSHDSLGFVVRSEAIRRRAAALRAEACARRLRLQDEYIRARYLRSVTRHLVELMHENLGPPTPNPLCNLVRR